MHLAGKIDVDNLDLDARRARKFIPDHQYNASKLAMVYQSNELARQFAENGFNVESVALHPGLVTTSIFRNTKEHMKNLLTIFFFVFGKNARQGAQSTIWAVVTDQILNGKYLMDCRVQSLLVRKSNTELEKRFYAQTKKILKLQ